MAKLVPPSRLDRLEALGALLVGSCPDTPLGVGVIGLDRSELELAVKPLDCPDVVCALAGLAAPAAWDAFGVVAPAHAHLLDREEPPIRVVIAVLASRDGITSHRLRGTTSECPTTGGEGRMLDACRRVLGLPTPPAEHATDLWSALDWVDRALAAVLHADLGEPPSWATLRRLDRGRHHAGRAWSALRRDCAAGRVTIPGVGPVAAGWMDDGMFSREALAAYPSLFDSLHDLHELLPPSTFDALLTGLAERLNSGRTRP
jgi:hypothetical protein